MEPPAETYRPGARRGRPQGTDRSPRLALAASFRVRFPLNLSPFLHVGSVFSLPRCSLLGGILTSLFYVGPELAGSLFSAAPDRFGLFAPRSLFPGAIRNAVGLITVRFLHQ
jgi:hypothetical protein